MIVKLKLCTFSLEFHLGQFVWSCYKLLANDNMNGIERNFERFTRASLRAGSLITIQTSYETPTVSVICHP